MHVWIVHLLNKSQIVRELYNPEVYESSTFYEFHNTCAFGIAQVLCNSATSSSLVRFQIEVLLDKSRIVRLIRLVLKLQ